MNNWTNWSIFKPIKDILNNIQEIKDQQRIFKESFILINHKFNDGHQENILKEVSEIQKITQLQKDSLMETNDLLMDTNDLLMDTHDLLSKNSTRLNTYLDARTSQLPNEAKNHKIILNYFKTLNNSLDNIKKVFLFIQSLGLKNAEDVNNFRDDLIKFNQAVDNLPEDILNKYLPERKLIMNGKHIDINWEPVIDWEPVVDVDDSEDDIDWEPVVDVDDDWEPVVDVDDDCEPVVDVDDYKGDKSGDHKNETNLFINAGNAGISMQETQHSKPIVKTNDSTILPKKKIERKTKVIKWIIRFIIITPILYSAVIMFLANDFVEFNDQNFNIRDDFNNPFISESIDLDKDREGTDSIDDDIRA